MIVGIPLSVEVIDCWSVGFEPYPSSERLILFWLSVIPLSVEVIVVVPYHLSRGCCCYFREEVCTLSLYYPNPQWRFPVWEVLCGRYSENPSV